MHLEAERLALLAKAERERLEEEFKRLVAEARSKAQEAAVRRAEVQGSLACTKCPTNAMCHPASKYR